MPRDIYDERLRLSRPHFFAWEAQEAVESSFDDIDEEKLRNAVRYGIQMGRINNSAEGATVESLLSKFKLVKNGKLTNAAIMLFGNDTSDYPQLKIRMARFRGLDKNEFIDNQYISGNFFTMLDASMAFFFKHLNLSGKIVGIRREEHLEIPQEALREATINALCHRSMDNTSASMSIAIYDNRIEIYNPGGLPKELSVDSLKKPHESFPRNIRIAQVLYLTGYLESWGSGIKRIIDACREVNIPEPEYYADEYSVKVIFRRQNKDTNTQTGTKQTLSRHQVGIKLGLSSEQSGILFDLLSTPVSASVLRNALGYKDATKFKKRYLDMLLEKSIIAQTDPEHPTNPNQKYYLTEKGKKIL
jgi:ATP-dependent DNA helicase RecG